MRYILMYLFVWISCNSCNRQTASTSTSSEIKNFSIYINRLAEKSSIEVVPKWIKKTHEEKIDGLEKITTKNKNDGLKLIYPSGKLQIPIEFLDFYGMGNKELENANLTNYEYWKDSLFLKPVGRERLENMSVEERSDYVEKIGFKASLMHSRKQCYISEGLSYKVVLFVGNEGKLYGRIWNHSDGTKDFSGKFWGGIDDTLTVIYELSERGY